MRASWNRTIAGHQLRIDQRKILPNILLLVASINKRKRGADVEVRQAKGGVSRNGYHFSKYPSLRARRSKVANEFFSPCVTRCTYSSCLFPANEKGSIANSFSDALRSTIAPAIVLADFPNRTPDLDEVTRRRCHALLVNEFVLTWEQPPRNLRASTNPRIVAVAANRAHLLVLSTHPPNFRVVVGGVQNVGEPISRARRAQWYHSGSRLDSRPTFPLHPFRHEPLRRLPDSRCWYRVGRARRFATIRGIAYSVSRIEFVQDSLLLHELVQEPCVKDRWRDVVVSATQYRPGTRWGACR